MSDFFGTMRLVGTLHVPPPMPGPNELPSNEECRSIFPGLIDADVLAVQYGPSYVRHLIAMEALVPA